VEKEKELTMHANERLIPTTIKEHVPIARFNQVTFLCFFLLAWLPAIGVRAQLHRELWTLWQQSTVARIDLPAGTWTNFGSTGMIDPARPGDPPGLGWTTIAMAPDRTLYMIRRLQTGGIWLYSLSADNIQVTGLNITNLQLVGPTGLDGNVDGLTAGPDGNVYFTAYKLTGPQPNGLYRYRLSTHAVEYVGTFASSGGISGPRSFWTDLAFNPNGGDLVGQGFDPTGAHALYSIPRASVLTGTNQTFAWQTFTPQTFTADTKSVVDGIAFDPTNGDAFLSGDGQGVYSFSTSTPTLISGTNNELGWDLANQVLGCSETRPIRTLCVPGTPGDFTFTFEVTNHSGATAYSWSAPDSLPYTISPHSQPLTPPLPDGGTREITVTIHGAATGQTVCVKGVLFGEGRDHCCCKFQVCTTIPECTCLQIYRDFPPRCTGSPDGSFTYTFQIQNLSPNFVGVVFVHPPPGITITPDYFTVSPPIPPNGIDPVFHTITIIGATPGSQLCFDISIHDADLNDCCQKRICIDVPYCEWFWWDDIGLVTTRGAGPGLADVSQTPTGAAVDAVIVNHHAGSPDLAADGFSVSKPAAIDVISIPVFAAGSGMNTPFDFLSIEVWNGPPNAPNSRRVYGDIDRNVLQSGAFSGIYRVPEGEKLDSDQRPIWFADAVLRTAMVLPAGNYWLVWSVGGPSDAAIALPYKVTTSSVAPGEALQRIGGVWRPANAGKAWPKGVALPFLLRGKFLPSEPAIPIREPESLPGREETPH
jgi:hypothetical protein